MAAMAVTDGDIPIGLVMSIHLDRILSHRYGVSLFENRAIRDIMDASPLIVEDDAALEEVADLAMRRDRRKIYDHVLITSKGRLTGMVSVQTMLLSLVESEKERTIELVTANRMLQEEIGERKSVEQQLVQ
jgi:CBS domain-containing protein